MENESGLNRPLAFLCLQTQSSFSPNTDWGFKTVGASGCWKVSRRGWALNDDELIQMADQGIRRAREIFSKSAPWHPDLIYFWEANKDAVKGPLGMSYLFAEKNRKRWAVWVMD